MRLRSSAGEATPWVLVSAGFHEQGGQSKATAALADYLLDRGTPVHLVAHDLDGRFLDRPGCTVHRVPRPGGADFLGVLWLRRRGRAVAARVCAACPGTRVVVNGGCCHWGDVNWVHYLHNAWSPSLAGMPLRHRLKEAVAGAFFRRHERRALRAARLVIANSERTRAEIVRCLKIDPTRIHTVSYGGEAAWRPPTAQERAAARAWLGQAEQRPLVVFVGGFGRDERKGFDSLWEAWRELCKDPGWDADLVAAGGGASAAMWQERVRQAGLAERVRLIGFTDRVYDVLAAADLLVSPTRYEPYGLNVQEAVCRGVPALVSACAGATEQYPPDCAELILPDPDNVADLAQRLRRWRADMTGWRRRFAALSAVLRDYNWADMAERIVTLARGLPPGSPRGAVTNDSRRASL
jgi:glycosyltransferase involved in cell wall biosynthesis